MLIKSVHNFELSHINRLDTWTGPIVWDYSGLISRMQPELLGQNSPGLISSQVDLIVLNLCCCFLTEALQTAWGATAHAAQTHLLNSLKINTSVTERYGPTRFSSLHPNTVFDHRCQKVFYSMYKPQNVQEPLLLTIQHWNYKSQEESGDFLHG